MRNFIRYILFLPAAILAQPTLSQQVDFYAPELFPANVSGAVIGFSVSGKTIYFVREDTVKDLLTMYTAQRVGKRWTDERPLPFSGEYNDMGGRLTIDGNALYFTSDRPNGSNRDGDVWNIWKTERSGDSWTDPEPLSSVNNLGDECCPTPMPDGSIIFSSDRGKQMAWWIYSLNETASEKVEALTESQAMQWPSYYSPDQKILLLNSMRRNDSRGKDDIYFSHYQNGKWSAPVNLGAPVNTEVYEDGAILSPDGRLLIFNRHTTGSTPSRVMAADWRALRKKLLKRAGR